MSSEDFALFERQKEEVRVEENVGRLETLRKLYETYPALPEVAHRYATWLAAVQTREPHERDRRALVVFRRLGEQGEGQETKVFHGWKGKAGTREDAVSGGTMTTTSCR